MAAVSQIQALLSLFRHVNDLKLLPRTGWLLAGVSPAESVAEHSYATGTFALFLTEWINQEYPSQGLDAPLNVERVVTTALIHDLAESVLTDLPKRSSHALGGDVKERAEGEIVDTLLLALPRGEYYRDLWREYATAATPEARLVKDVDKLEMVFQALRYARGGHSGLDEFWEGHDWYYPICHLCFQNLLAQRPGSPD